MGIHTGRRIGLLVSVLAFLSPFPFCNSAFAQATVPPALNPDRKKPAPTPFAENPFILSLLRDASGAFWIGTEGDGLYRYNPALPIDDAWNRFTPSDGLGDDQIHALARDTHGRLWVGHLNHGVSVYNGQKWQNYEPVARLSNPDSLAGPLGDRVFAIAVNPVDGDVWIATNAGLSRYSDKSNTWSYFTRSNGLPSDHPNCIAFDKTGKIYAGTQTQGLAIASPSDNYKTWTSVKGPDDMPVDPVGKGLPTSLINDVRIAKNGVVYVATPYGLAWSCDQGKSWIYARGKDWSEKVKNLLAGAPEGWSADKIPAIPKPADSPVVMPTGAFLAEDYVTTIAEGDNGVWVGYRQKGYDFIDTKTGKVKNVARRGYVTKIVPEADECVVATYGSNSIFLPPLADNPNPLAAVGMVDAVGKQFPQGATPLKTPELQAISESFSKLEAEKQPLYYVGSDWSTQGDWVGRYGRQYAVLCAAGSPMDHDFTLLLKGYRIKGQMKHLLAERDSIRLWCWSAKSEERRVLWDLEVGIRRPASWVDNGQAYSMMKQGPDLQIDVNVPDGANLISLYFMNYDGHTGNNLYRDLLITPQYEDQPALNTETARVVNYYDGVYQNFIATKGGKYSFTVARNYSFNVMVAGVFVSRLHGEEEEVEKKLAFPWMGNLPYHAPAVDWDKTELPFAEDILTAKPNTHILARKEMMTQMLRATSPIKDNVYIRENLRWNANLWTTEDRKIFDETMAQAWTKMQDMNPHLKTKEMRPNSPGVE